MKVLVVALIVLAACGFEGQGPMAQSDDVQPTLPAVGFAAATSEADEMSSALEIPVVLSVAHDLPVTVAYAVGGGTAIADDYTFTAGTLTFAPGEMAKPIALAIRPDAIEEPAETIELVLASPTEATLGTATHTITIANDILPRVELASSSIDVLEGEATEVQLVLDKPSPIDVSIEVAVTGGTATETADYTFQSNITVTFPAGETMQAVSLDAVEDALDEDDEIVALALANPSMGVLPGVTFSGDVKLVDDDDSPTASFLTGTSASGEFGSPGMIVRLSAASGRTVTVPFQVVAGATAATPTTDYTIDASPLVFPPGTTDLVIRVTIVADDQSERDETVDVDLLAPTNATLGQITHRTHTILDNDQVSVQWVQQSGSANEGDSNTSYKLTITLSQASAQTVTVDIQVDTGTTASATDFVVAPTTVTFVPGDTSQQIDFTIIGDNFNENDEIVFLRLANPSGGAILGNPARRSITIFDDDGGP